MLNQLSLFTYKNKHFHENFLLFFETSILFSFGFSLNLPQSLTKVIFFLCSPEKAFPFRFNCIPTTDKLLPTSGFFFMIAEKKIPVFVEKKKSIIFHISSAASPNRPSSAKSAITDLLSLLFHIGNNSYPQWMHQNQHPKMNSHKNTKLG